MSFTVELSARATRYLDRLDEPTRQRFLHAFSRLAEDPYGPGSKPLQGRPDRVFRVGGWRVIYDVDRLSGLVKVTAIAPRGQVYRDR